MVGTDAKANGMVPVFLMIAGPHSPAAAGEVGGDEAPERYVQEYSATEVFPVAPLAPVDPHDVLASSQSHGIRWDGCQSWRGVNPPVQPGTADQGKAERGDAEHADQTAEADGGPFEGAWKWHVAPSLLTWLLPNV